MQLEIAKRIVKLQAVLQTKKINAALIYDRENLIYFAGVDDLEGGVLCVPSEGEPELFCLAWDAEHMRETSNIDKVTPYPFPKESQSLKAAQWLKTQNYKNPKVGFTRYFISLKDYQCLLSAVPNFVVADIASDCYKIRSVKDKTEIALIREAGHALEAGMKTAFEKIHPGLTETELLAEAAYAMGKAGSQGSPFRMQVLTHDRQMLMHPYASNAVITNNEPVVIHLGASVKGYVAKMCRTVFLGNVGEEIRDVYKYLREAQSVAMNLIKPGIACGEVFDAVNKYVKTTPFASFWVMEHIGYGVGIRQSEFYPIIAKGSNTVLEENMVIDLLLPTFYKAKIGGPRITDTILIKKDGTEFLTNYNRKEVVKK